MLVTNLIRKNSYFVLFCLTGMKNIALCDDVIFACGGVAIRQPVATRQPVAMAILRRLILKYRLLDVIPTPVIPPSRFNRLYLGQN
ncbi:MAG: hypothetical protein ACR2NY_00875 [Alphaproteobacteria bacterium]